jgi:hypothetical protein
MRKSLPLLIAVLAIALIGSSAFAYAPVMQPLPNVWIGDIEDNVGTVDNNLFRFSDAFDLDMYVTDDDTTISELVWSFYEMGNGYLEVNGVTELATPADAIDAAAGAKDIRHQGAPFDDSLVDFWDLKDSPKPLSLPYPSPTAPLNEVVTFFVSDGAFVDSGETVIQADDGGPDRVSDTTSWIVVDSWDFEGTAGWTFTGPAIDSADVACLGATSVYDGSRLGTDTAGTTSRFGYWTAPSQVPYAADKLFKYEWMGVSSNNTSSTNDPTVRFRVNSFDFATAFEMIISSVGTDPPFAPTTTPRDYTMYYMPYHASDMTPAFDVYDFDPSDTGIIYLDELVVSETDAPTADWTAVSYPAFGTWTALTSISPYGTVTSGTSGGLQLTSTVSAGFNYGFWQSSAGGTIPMAADTMYRVLATIASSDASPPQAFMRVSSADFQVTYRFKADGLTVAPDADGEVYPIYFEDHDAYVGLEAFNLAFEIFDGDSARGGTITLTDVDVESHALIP